MNKHAKLSDAPIAIAIFTSALIAVAIVLLTTSGSDSARAAQPTATTSAISYSKARSILLKKVIKPSSLAAGDSVIAFGKRKPLPAGTRVTPYRKRGTSTKLRSKSWFFWIDDDPRAQFEHSTRYVFINARTGKIKVLKVKWWPLIDGKAPWFTPSAYWKKSNWAYSNVTPPAGFARVRASAPSPTVRQAASTAECAVLIAGSNDAKAGFLDDVDGMERAIKGFGYTTTKIKPPDKNGKAEFEAAVDAAVKDGCKNALLYIASHGGKESMDMGKGSYTAANLKALIEKYPTTTFKVVLQGCKTGSWIDPLAGKTEIIITSTDATKPSYSADPDTASDPNPDDKGSEFTSGLVEDLELILKTPGHLQRVQNCINGNPPSVPGKPPLVCKLEIAFESALDKDEDAKAGNEAPQRKLK